jgi:hypothetical protein
MRPPIASLAARFPRDASSNQRLLFDLDSTGRTLWTGSRDGAVLVYDTHALSLVASLRGLPDAVAGVACHPAGVAFALAIGERHDRGAGSRGAADSSSDEEAPFSGPSASDDGRGGGTLTIWRCAAS